MSREGEERRQKKGKKMEKKEKDEARIFAKAHRSSLLHEQGSTGWSSVTPNDVANLIKLRKRFRVAL